MSETLNNLIYHDNYLFTSILGLYILFIDHADHHKGIGTEWHSRNLPFTFD